MDPDHLTSLLAERASERPVRSPACPDESRIAGYIDGGLDAAIRQQLEQHLADCGHCLALVGLLSRERSASASESVSSPVLAQVGARAREQSQRPWRFAPQWAAAAAVVLAVPLLVQLGRSPDAGLEGQGRPAPPAIRKSESTPDTLQVLVPGAGGAVDARRAQFRWTEVAGSPYYEVRIVTDDGAVVVRERVTGTAWQLPAQVQLQPGAEYFVHVDAYPSGDKAVSSDHVPFRVSD
jgi:anti-sigma factor RsiW